MQSHLRYAQREDLEEVNLIYNQAVEEGFCTAHLEVVDMEERHRWFDSHPHDCYPVFVMEKEGRIAGWISLGPYREGRQALAHVAEVSYYVHREFRREGVGGVLMEHVLSVAGEYGFSVLIAILLGENKGSINYLEKFGFSRWGVMPGIAQIGEVRADHLYYGLRIS